VLHDFSLCVSPPQRLSPSRGGEVLPAQTKLKCCRECGVGLELPGRDGVVGEVRDAGEVNSDDVDGFGGDEGGTGVAAEGRAVVCDALTVRPKEETSVRPLRRPGWKRLRSKMARKMFA